MLRCAAFALLLPCAAVLHADDLTVTTDGEPLSLALPQDVAAAGGEFLVELDGYDVTAVVEFDAQQLRLPIASLALEPGQHALRVTRTDADGTTTLLFDHVLDVFQHPGVRRASRQWNVLLSSAWQIDAHPGSPGTDQSQADSTLQWGGEYERASWRVQDSVSAMYSGAGTPGFDAWQLPAYELRAERIFRSGRIGLALGDDGIPVESLLFSGFSRRGLRVDLSAFEERVALQAFTLHTDPVTTADVDLVPVDSGSSMLGGFASVAALTGHPEALVFSAGWVDGSGTNGGAAVANPGGAFSTGGSAWNLSVDSHTWQRSLWLHGEYARSHFDADGSGVRVGDAARLASLQFSSDGGLAFATLDRWALGAEQRRVGAHFFALSNLALPGDLDSRRAYAELGRRGFGLNLSVLAQRSDLDDQPLHPRIDTRSHGAAVSYAPMWADGEKTPWRWLGTPALNMSYERSTNAQRDGDALALGFDVNNVQRAFVSGLQFSGEVFSLGFDFSRLERDDRSLPLVVDGFTIYLPEADSREHSLGVNTSWRIGERLSISPQWQRVRRREAGGAVSHNDLWSLQLQATLVPQVLSVQASWSDARDALTSTDPLTGAERGRNSGGAFDLAFSPPFARNTLLPQLDCHLRATYAGRATSFAAQSFAEREWQVSLSVDFTWSRGH